MRDPKQKAAETCVFEDALPDQLCDRLVNAVRGLGSERLKDNGTYTTTFWYPRGAEPRNIAEKAVVELLKLVDPPEECIGMEWWLGRLGYGKKLGFHFDRDLALKKKTGESVFPIFASVLYLNDFPTSPTIVLDQVLGADGKTKVPETPEFGMSVPAVQNHYVVFPGQLYHGVVADPLKPKTENTPPDLRMTLLVNYWHQRPLPPVCDDYDGSVYSSLVHA